MNSKDIGVVLRKNKQWSLVMEVARRVKKAGGRALVVGGAVRDALGIVQRTTYHVQRLKIKDFDLEVYGINKPALKHLLLDVVRGTLYVKQGFVLKEVGQQFGVFNLGGVEIAIPRTDSRTRSGMGRKPQVVSQPDLTFEQASKRRDLTINAMGFDPLTDELLDANNGQRDLKSGLLRAVDEKSFGDDPLRVLRVMQFAGRFGFKVDAKTIELSRKISLKHLAKERVGEEWTKLLFKADRPSVGLEVGKKLGIFAKLHPALEHLSAADWNATMRNVGRISLFCHSCVGENPEKVFQFVVLCHRMTPRDTKAFLKQINCSNKETDQVLGLLKVMSGIKSKKMTNELVRRVSYRVSQVDDGMTLNKIMPLVEVIFGHRQLQELTLIAKKLHIFNSAPVNLLSGKDLLHLGVQPGKKMGELLQKAFNRQLKGVFDDKRHKPQREKALEWVTSVISSGVGRSREISMQNN
ncbi:MAG: hypothetical protein WCT54_04775 [Patescibacteria group bacterium]